MKMTTIRRWTGSSRRSFIDSSLAVQRKTRRSDTAQCNSWQSSSSPCKVFRRKSTGHYVNSANDKDATVRVQVVIVLGKLAHGEDLPAREGGVQSLTEILRNLMQFDPSPEVRRAALPGVHTQLNKQTLLLSTRQRLGCERAPYRLPCPQNQGYADESIG